MCLFHIKISLLKFQTYSYFLELLLNFFNYICFSFLFEDSNYMYVYAFSPYLFFHSDPFYCFLYFCVSLFSLTFLLINFFWFYLISDNFSYSLLSCHFTYDFIYVWWVLFFQTKFSWFIIAHFEILDYSFWVHIFWFVLIVGWDI